MEKMIRVLSLSLVALVMAACGGAPSENPNIGGGDTDDGVTSIVFVSAAPTQIRLKGQGGVEESIVTFRTQDSTSQPKSGVSVSFELVNGIGGADLLGNTLGLRSDSEGEVAVTVASGTVAGSVTVRATIDGADTFALSSAIEVSSGTPVANNISIAASPDWFVERAFDENGVEVPIVLSAGDQFNNPAFNGVTVSFWSESGLIQPSCTLSGGTCSVTWQSSGSNLAADRLARVFAYLEGAEQFTDLNGNNIYDEGEVFVDIGEPFSDNNENGVYDIGEFFVDIDGDAIYDSAGNGVYDGPCIAEGCTPSSTILSIQDSLYLCSELIANTGDGGFCGM